MFILAAIKKYRTSIATGAPTKELLGVSVLPPVVGNVLADRLTLTINSVDYLNDIYVNKNMFMTKHTRTSRPWSKLLRRSLVFD